MPPAVALLNFISSDILWRIFSQTGTFPGVFINNTVRISEAAMGGAGDIILIKKNKTKKVRTYGRIVIYINYKKKALDVGDPSSIDFKYFWGSNKRQRSCVGQGGGGRAAPRSAC